jgi:hypothetical protein
MLTVRNALTVRLVIHNECRDDESEAFLGDFAPRQAERMARRLGAAFEESVHVVLSARRKHVRRFPPDVAQLGGVVDPEEREQATEDELRQRYPPKFYAHGVATTVQHEHKAPTAAVVGEAAIYLDVETIRDVAGGLRVSHEAVLAHVVSHELAHVLREDHRTGTDTSVNGWFAEGDAQRDAWQSLTDALADPQSTTFAREGRAAQVRMAQHQPAAYRYFDASSLDRMALLGDFPLPERRSWVAGTPRGLSNVMVQADAEIPVHGAELPKPGDIVYLGDYFALVGPWLVMAAHSEPRVGHAADLQAVETHAKPKPRQAPELLRWLQLRRLGDAKAGDRPEEVPVGSLVPKPLSRERAESLPSLLHDEIETRARALEA